MKHTQELTKALEIEASLLAEGIGVIDTKYLPNGQQIKLECGAVINVYRNGSILVQGRLRPGGYPETLRRVRKILPVSACWKMS